MIKKVFNTALILIVSYLVVTLVASTIISHVKSRKTRFSSQEVVNYATSFMIDKQRGLLGKEKDCSGFTKLIYSEFGVELPPLAASQHDFCSTFIEGSIPSDLVFFAIESSNINHVGIMIGDSTFIHSPGKKRLVRVDNLKTEYWTNYFIGYGRILNNNRNED